MSTKQIIMTAKEFAFDLLQAIDDGVREHTTAFVASGFIGAVAGLGVWCFVNSGLLASNPLIIFLAVHPIGWSIVAGSLVFGLHFLNSKFACLSRGNSALKFLFTAFMLIHQSNIGITLQLKLVDLVIVSAENSKLPKTCDR